MPAQIHLTKEQIRVINDFDTDVIVLEGPLKDDGGNVLDVWVMDAASLAADTHRSVILDEDGNILADSVQGDDEA